MLNEKRESVLRGGYEGSDVALRNQKSRLRQSSRTVLDELLQIARSPHIDNTEVFDPDKMFLLLQALLTPTRDNYKDGLQGGLHFGTDGTTDEFQAYHDRLTTQMAKLILAGDYGGDDV